MHFSFITAIQHVNHVVFVILHGTVQQSVTNVVQHLKADVAEFALMFQQFLEVLDARASFNGRGQRYKWASGGPTADCAELEMRAWVCVAWLAAAAALAAAQLTFTSNWGSGKRAAPAAPPPRCIDTDALVTLYRMIAVSRTLRWRRFRLVHWSADGAGTADSVPNERALLHHSFELSLSFERSRKTSRVPENITKTVLALSVTGDP
ncbi:hypothetical protein EVAR_77741_1 [Eumeta japonica]|uniref:Uncharacterized protein n=1 Tax=Eumeta variegata TaxID=151549 RepID=A0A4C1TDY0_EUMVA|nr:hypothetical protein EVAR_77741_1 [Eumeta japonica]